MPDNFFEYFHEGVKIHVMWHERRRFKFIEIDQTEGAIQTWNLFPPANKSTTKIY